MRTIVIGCGPAGLGAAISLREAGADMQVIDGADRPGGLAVTDRLDGYLLDRTGHFLHTRSDRFESVLRSAGVPLEKIRRRSAVVLDRDIVPFPIQYNLWATRQDVREAVMREISARRISADVGEGSLGRALLQTWGPTLVERFFRPYNEKMFGCRLEDIPADCLGRFVPRLDDGLFRSGCERPNEGFGYNPTFLYPASGAIGDLFDAIARPLMDLMYLGETVLEIDTAARHCVLKDRRVRYDRIISTVALPELLRLCHLMPSPNLPLQHANVLNVRVGFRGRMLRNEHWAYVPDPSLPFYRVGFPWNVNPRTCPSERASLSIECGFAHQHADAVFVQTVVDSAIQFVREAGFAEIETVDVVDTRLITPAYVVHRSAERQSFSQIFEKLASLGIFPCGRFGRWEYFSMEDSFLDGERAAREALESRA